MNNYACAHNDKFIAGVVISGYGQGESFEKKKEVIRAIRESISAVLPMEQAMVTPILVQGLNDLEQVCVSECDYSYLFLICVAPC